MCKNYDALQTLGEEALLKGLVVSTLNKLAQVKPNLLRINDNWEDWDMKELLLAIEGWLKRNKVEERSLITEGGEIVVGTHGRVASMFKEKVGTPVVSFVRGSTRVMNATHMTH